MKKPRPFCTAAGCLLFCFAAALVHGQNPAPGDKPKVSMKISGTFDVKMTPLTLADDRPAESGAAKLGRMSLDKQYHGSLTATATGEMLSAMSSVGGSAGYVAIERVNGTLDGRSGSFALQHTGTMTRGAPELLIRVVPDSGTGQLTGLTGTMGIRIEAGGKHFYDFEYTLPEAR